MQQYAAFCAFLPLIAIGKHTAFPEKRRTDLQQTLTHTYAGKLVCQKQVSHLRCTCVNLLQRRDASVPTRRKTMPPLPARQRNTTDMNDVL